MNRRASAPSDAGTGAIETRSFWRRLPARRCLNCGSRLAEGARDEAVCCSSACRVAYHNRVKHRGALIYPQAMRAFLSRNSAERRALNRLVDHFRREDELAGRPVATYQCYAAAPAWAYGATVADPQRAQARAVLRERERSDAEEAEARKRRSGQANGLT